MTETKGVALPEGKACHVFSISDAEQAFHERDFDTVIEYGDRCYGHFLYALDDGNRFLARCRKCGGYFLGQISEYHGIETDDLYADFFPVAGPQEADQLNRQYDGDAIERQFPYKHLMFSHGHIYWSDKPSIASERIARIVSDESKQQE